MCTEKGLGVLTIITAVFMFLMQGWYWYYLSLALEIKDWAAVTVYIISAILVIAMAIIGIAGVIKQSTALLAYYALVMITMLVFGLVQLVLVIYSAHDCSNKSNPFTFICQVDDIQAAWQYWLPSALILFGAMCGALFSLLLRRQLNGSVSGGKSNYY